MSDSGLPGRHDDLNALLGRVGLGDRAAFSRLYEQTSRHLLGVILRIQTDRGQAEELLQEVFINVWRSAGSYDSLRSASMTWLVSIARNRAIDSLRRRDTQPRLVSTSKAGMDEDHEDDMLEQMASDDPGPAEVLETNLLAQAVRGCLGVLSAQQQQSVALAFYRGLSHAEVAEEMREPLGSVKSWLRRGLLALRDCLASGPQPGSSTSARA